MYLNFCVSAGDGYSSAASAYPSLADGPVRFDANVCSNLRCAIHNRNLQLFLKFYLFSNIESFFLFSQNEVIARC